MSTVPYPQFRGNAEKCPFFCYLNVPSRNKILENVLVCLKENYPGFQQTPLDIMFNTCYYVIIYYWILCYCIKHHRLLCQGSLYPFLCPNSKVLTLPQLSLIIVGAPVTII